MAVQIPAESDSIKYENAGEYNNLAVIESAVPIEYGKAGECSVLTVLE